MGSISGARKNTYTVTTVIFSVPANSIFRLQAHFLKNHEEAKNWRLSLNMKPSTIAVLRDGLRKVITEGTASKYVTSKSLPQTQSSGD
ncbi:MAG: hypothetical protein C4323_13995 [Mastigocladus sp. ERB_26_2]